MSQIFSLEIERLVLASILQYPEIYPDICNWLEPSDFVSRPHSVIYSILQRKMNKSEEINPTILVQEINNLGIKFKDLDSPFEYINDGLKLLQTTPKAGIEAVKELKKYTVAREISETCLNIDKKIKSSLNLNAQELIDLSDDEYHCKIKTFYQNTDIVNLFDGLSADIEEMGNNPNDNKYLLGPHQKLNELYGSLVRPGNLTTICARSGSFKTTFLLHYGTSLAHIHNIPVLHLDNGEMSPSELRLRQAASLSGVPLHMIENGSFRKNEEATAALRKIYPILDKLKYYYIPVGGKNSTQILGLIRRAYYSKIGRGNPTAVIFDYWKSYSDDYQNKQEYERMGKLTQDFKDFITNEVPIGILSGLQGNRYAIVTNKKSQEVVDNEGVASGGDRIVFHSSHFFILRKKTLDQLAEENNKFGNCIMQNIAKCRHLGVNIKDALNPVKMPDGSFKLNYINFDINNFNVVERGDLASTKDELNQLDITDEDEEKEDDGGTL